MPALSLSFAMVKIFALPWFCLPLITAAIALPLFLLTYSLPPSWRVHEAENRRREVIELENFLTIFSTYLRLGLSPETSLLMACEQYSGELKSLLSATVQAVITAGGAASYALAALSKRLKSPECKRILILFSRALNKDAKLFGDTALSIISCLKENRALKDYVNLLYSKMRLRASLLTIVSSAVLAVMTRLAPLISILKLSATSTTAHSVGFQSESNSLFVAMIMMNFMNAYFVSLAVHHKHPILISATSTAVYILVYLLFPQLILSF